MNIVNKILIISLVLLGILLLTGSANAATWTVDDSGGAHFTKIQDAVDAADIGDIIYVYNGTYHEHITITKSLILSGQSESNAIIDGNGSDNAIHISNSDVIINKFTLKNAGVYGLYAINSNVNVDSVTITSNGNNGIYFVHGKGFTIRNSTIDGNGGGIIYYDNAASDAIVEDNTITNNVGSGVHIGLVEGKSATIRNNKIDNNAGASSNGMYVGIAGTGGIMNIQNNPVTNSGSHGIYLSGVKSGSTVKDFNIQNSGSHGLRADYSDLNLENVTTINNSGHGIYFVHGKDFTIRNSTIDGNGGGIIYHDNAASDAIVEDNTITNNVGSGVHIGLVEGKSATIRNNKIDNNAGASSNGMYVGIAGTGGIMNIQNNPVTNSGRYGIYLIGAKNSMIIDNNISTNIYGVRLDSSSNNLIYHNNFIDNKNYNANDNGGSNTWDDGYPSGGNYWSDYTGNDNFKGPDQDQTGSDGIGDTPYDIAGSIGGKDFYPFIEPLNGIYNEFDIQLSVGWNLISFPLIPKDTDVVSVLSPINGNYSIVWEYNASDTTDHWKKYDPSAPFGNDLINMEPGKGYWIMMISDDTLTISGTVPESTDINLKTDWNLIGYNSLDRQPVADALSSISSNYTIVWAYDASNPVDHWKKYDPDAPFGNDLADMEPGRGYWIMMTSEGILET